MQGSGSIGDIPHAEGNGHHVKGVLGEVQVFCIREGETDVGRPAVKFLPGFAEHLPAEVNAHDRTLFHFL
jgi:hypothetical protein